jgi:hypothetical protein
MYPKNWFLCRIAPICGPIPFTVDALELDRPHKGGSIEKWRPAIRLKIGFSRFAAINLLLCTKQ